MKIKIGKEVVEIQGEIRKSDMSHTEKRRVRDWGDMVLGSGSTGG